MSARRAGTSGNSPRRAKSPAPSDTGDEVNVSRDRILDVAMREFAQKGFSGARVDEIAARAKVNKQLLYYYFGDKRGLYEAAVYHVAEEYKEFYEAGPPGERYVDRMARYTRRQNNADQTLWRRMLLWEALQGIVAPADEESPSAKGWADAVAEIKAAQDDGELDPSLDTEMLTLAIVGVVHLPHILVQGTRAITGHLPSDPEFVERQAEFIRSFIKVLGARE